MLGEADEATLARYRAKLFEARAKRVPPGRDDKVLADWNGLAIAALVRAAAVFGRPEWLDAARRAFDTVAARMAAPDGRLMHALRHGQVSAAGLLEDHAAMARAALALFEATGEDGYLRHALGWAEAVERHFAAAGGRRLLHLRRRCRRRAGARPHRGRQRDALRQRADGGGAGAAVPPDGRRPLAPRRGIHDRRLRRQRQRAGRHADLARRRPTC